MLRLLKSRSRKAGLPPGTLIPVGEQKNSQYQIEIIDYSETSYHESRPEAITQCFDFKNKPTVTWINFEGIPPAETIGKLGECYGFHPLVLEDVLNSDQRPKVEDYEKYLYLVLKMLSYDEKNNQIVAEQVSFILGENYLFTFQEGLEGDVFDSVRERLKNSKGSIRKLGADYLAYSLLDAIVDYYFLILEKIGEKIEFLEEKLVANPVPKSLKDLNDLKREMLFLRKSVWPLREVTGALERGDLSLIKKSTEVYLRDVYSHIIQVIDAVETYRDMLSGMLDIYLSSVSNRLNEVMKVLTIIATIFMPLTFLAGVYGMNFKYMPELGWKLGYPLVWAVMLVVASIMVAYFKKKKWL